MNKLLVYYTLSANRERETSNKPEERQHKIIDKLKMNKFCDLFNTDLKISEKMCKTIMKNINDLNIHDTKYLNFLLNAYDSFKNDSEYDNEHSIIENEGEETDKIGLIPTVS